MSIYMLKRNIPVLLLSALSVRAQAPTSRPLVNTPIAAISPASSLPDHKIVPNDLLNIQVFDEPEVSRPGVRVSSDGTVVIPSLPKPLLVAGLLPREVEGEVRQALIDGQILIHPTVSVSILEYAYRLISIQGNVRTPGQFEITQPITLFEALSKAGGVTPEAGADVLVSKSPTDPPQKVNLIQLQINPDPSTNLILNGGELISVPEAPKVWVTGNVAHPGPVAIKTPGDATVLKVVATAAGLTQYYNKLAYIYRPDPSGKRQEITVPLRKIMQRKAQDVDLAVDDILLIPDDNGNARRTLLTTLQSLGGAASSSAVYVGMGR